MFIRFLMIAAISIAITTGARATSIISDFIADVNFDSDYFDFRNDFLYGDSGAFSECHGQNSCSRNDSNAGGYGITISADLPRLLFRANDDGFGIQGDEFDEIDSNEVLTISFDGGWRPTFLGLTDLFEALDGGIDGEEAIVRGIRGDALVYELRFVGELPLGTGNGEAVFALPGIAVDFLEFHSVEDTGLTFSLLTGNIPVGQSNDEYSVAFIAGAPIQVPEPGTLALFGLGLAGLGLMRRRRKAT